MCLDLIRISLVRHHFQKIGTASCFRVWVPDVSYGRWAGKCCCTAKRQQQQRNKAKNKNKNSRRWWIFFYVLFAMQCILTAHLL